MERTKEPELGASGSGVVSPPRRGSSMIAVSLKDSRRGSSTPGIVSPLTGGSQKDGAGGMTPRTVSQGKADTGHLGRTPSMMAVPEGEKINAPN